MATLYNEQKPILKRKEKEVSDLKHRNDDANKNSLQQLSIKNSSLKKLQEHLHASNLHKVRELSPEGEVREEFNPSRSHHKAPIQVTNEQVGDDQHQQHKQQEGAQRHASGKDGETAAVDAGAARNERHFLR